MTLSAAKLRAVVNLLSDPLQAAAANMPRSDAIHLRWLKQTQALAKAWAGNK
jgi:hypothetical protein